MLHVTEKDIRKGLGSTSSLHMSDITTEASRLAAFDHHERIWLGCDEARGLTAIVAIHSTRLGPALGGTRIWAHASVRRRPDRRPASVARHDPEGGGGRPAARRRQGRHHWPTAAEHKSIAMLEAYAEMLRVARRLTISPPKTSA